MSSLSSRPVRRTLATLAAAALAASLAASPARAQQLEGKVRRVTLTNGMRFLFYERHGVPTISSRIIFKVGSVDEVAGITGLAHLFEHMAFKGTSRLGAKDPTKEGGILARIETAAASLAAESAKGETADPNKVAALREEIESLTEEDRAVSDSGYIDSLYSQNGAEGLNAFTTNDTTNYVVAFPSNRLELWCAVESERVREAVLREFYVERDVVAEERRRSIDTQPGGKLSEAFYAAAFSAHPYGVPVIGWMSDINGMTATQAAAFRAKYYHPNNAVAALVGDFDTDRAVQLVEKYFGPLERGPDPPEVRTVEPDQAGERRVTVEFDAEPQIRIGYHKPIYPDPDDFGFTVLEEILTGGRASRLYADLVKERRLATGVFSSEGPGARYPNLFVISATPRYPHTAAEVEAAIYGHLDRLGKEPPTDREIQRVRNGLEANLIFSLDSNDGLAGQLAEYEMLYGDWKKLLTFEDRMRAVTAEDVSRVASKYLTARNRTVATLVKTAAAPADARAPGTRGGTP
jgi:predicted Zn-dependent peptidase